MSLIVKDITGYIEEFAPCHLAEDWDNVGLMVGGFHQEVSRVLICLDVTSKVVEEAVLKNVDLIISHHPFIFKPLKRIDEGDLKGRLLCKLIRNNISVYSAHTNLDVAENGINEYLAKRLGLLEIKNLNQYKSEALFKIVVFVPEDNIDAVRDAMCSAGAGWIGNYSNCSFSSHGIGTFKPLEGSKPFIGSQGELEKVKEFRLETVVPAQKLKKVLEAMTASHPYEEVAYDVFKLERPGKEYGLGKVGVLAKPVKLEDFIIKVKKELDAPTIRMIGGTGKEIRKVAVFCGSFDDHWGSVISQGVDVLVTGDLKYHSASDAAELGLCVIDAGHFNTERIIVPKLVEMISKKFQALEVITYSLESDPFKFC